MKKTLSLAVMVMAMGAGSAMAADPVAAGQITFNGQVDPATCIAKVVDGGKTSIGSDGTVTLKNRHSGRYESCRNRCTKHHWFES